VEEEEEKKKRRRRWDGWKGDGNCGLGVGGGGACVDGEREVRTRRVEERRGETRMVFLGAGVSSVTLFQEQQ
jgi:hypothetical protein